MADQLVVKTPGAIQDEHQPDLSRLSDEKLDQLERLIESAHPGKLLPASVAATVTDTVLFEVAASAAPPGLS